MPGEVRHVGNWLWGSAKRNAKMVTRSKWLLLIIVVSLVARGVLLTNYSESERATKGYSNDEVIQMNAILQMFNNKTVNPHFFDYPSFYLYIVGIVMLPLVLVGAATWSMAIMTGRILALIFNVLCIVMLYKLGKEVFGKREGLIAAAMFLCPFWLISLSSTVHPDTLQMFFLMSSLLYCVRIVRQPKATNFYLAALFAGLSMTTKYVGLFMWPIIVLAYFLSLPSTKAKFLTNLKEMVKKGFTSKVAPHKVVLTGVIFVLAFVIGTPSAVLSPMELGMGILRSAFLHVSPGETAGFYGGRLTWIYGLLGEFGVVLFAVAIIAIFYFLYQMRYVFWDWQRRREAVLLGWGIMMFSFLFAAFVITAGHYMIPIYPVIFVFTARFMVRFGEGVMGKWWRKDRAVMALKPRQIKLAKTVSVVLVAYVMISFGILGVANTMNRYNPEEHSTHYAAGDWLLSNAPHDSYIFYDNHIYVPPEFDNVMLNDFEPPEARELYNNTYSDFDELVISVHWNQKWQPPLDIVNGSRPDYILVNLKFADSYLTSNSPSELKVYFEMLLAGRLPYVEVARFEPEVSEIGAYDLGLSFIHDAATGAKLWDGPPIVIYERV